MNETLKRLITTSGKVIFIIGLVLNVCMVLFGIWPSLVYTLLMLIGASMFYFSDKPVAINIIYIPVSKILKVAAICVLGAGIVLVVIFFSSRDYVKKLNTISDCKEITAALKHYKVDKNTYPENLSVLMEGNPLRADWNKDKWGNAYQYTLINNGTAYVITSAGSDKKFGTSDDFKFSGY